MFAGGILVLMLKLMSNLGIMLLLIGLFVLTRRVWLGWKMRSRPEAV